MLRVFKTISSRNPAIRGEKTGPSGSVAARRGLALAGGFWLVIGVLLAARVALFDEIAAARLAAVVSTQFASLSSLLH